MTENKKEEAKGTTVPATTDARLSTNKGWDEITNQLMDYIAERQRAGLVLPQDYIPANAILAAKLHLLELRDKSDNSLIVDKATKGSVVNALQKMLVQGMNVYKKHGAFILYKDQLVWQNEYFGNLMVAKRDGGVKDCNAQVVYKNDEFEYMIDTKTGRKILTKHLQKFENRVNDDIVGAYAVVLYDDDSNKVEIMSIEEIRASWAMGGSRGDSKAHKQFTDQMCLKTVMNRSIKLDIGSSDDSEILPQGERDQAAEARDRKIREQKKKSGPTDIDFEEVKTGHSALELENRDPASKPEEKDPYA